MPSHKRQPRRNDKPNNRMGKGKAAVVQHPSPFAWSPFGKPDSPASKRFARLMQALTDWLGGINKRELAATAMELSTALAQHRGATVRRGYYDDEMLVSAYCAHFLPWNVYRLAYAWKASPPAVFAQLSDRPPEVVEGKQPPQAPLVEDWGAGPLVGLLALWVVTGINSRSMMYRAVERNADILHAGLDIAKALGIDKLCDIETIAEDIDLEAPAFGERRADLMIVSQSFNEWLPIRGRSTEEIRAFTKASLSRIHKGGELFVMEPASRIVSWGVMELRNAMREASRRILAPCTHYEACPLLDPRTKSWCHFRHPVEVHDRHAQLIKDFGLIELTKDTVSYSYLHIQHAHFNDQRAPVVAQAYRDAISLHTPEQRPNREVQAPPTAKVEALSPARVLSDPIRVKTGMGIYVCGPEGRLQVDTQASRWPRHVRTALRQNHIVLYPFPRSPFRDEKSRAVRIKLGDCVLPALAQDDLRDLLESRGDERER